MQNADSCVHYREAKPVDSALKHQTWQLRVHLLMLKALGSGVSATKHPTALQN